MLLWGAEMPWDQVLDDKKKVYIAGSFIIISLSSLLNLLLELEFVSRLIELIDLEVFVPMR